MKSANCISATGRMPMIAAPVHAPRIAVSARGASSTRQWPNSSWKPSVTLNAPPYTPTSSPMTNTRLSRRISVRSPSEIACRYVSSAILFVMRCVEIFWGCVDAFQQRRRIRQRRFLGALERIVQCLLDLARDLVFLFVGHVCVRAQPGPEALDRIVLRPLLEQLFRDVEGVVVHGVAFHPERDALDERGPAAGARLLDRALGLAVDREYVGAVDDDSLEAVRLCA